MAALTLPAVVVLTALASFSQQSTIETDLLQRARQALSEAGLPADGVYFNGRDSVLTGEVANEEASGLAEMVVQQVYGVRAVANQLAIKPGIQTGEMLDAGVAPTKGLHVPSHRYPVEQVDLHEVQFEYAKSELNSDAMNVLEEVAVLLRKSPEQVIEVSAHTDNQGTALGNLAVTNARANVIRDYLVSKGVNATQVVARGYGSMRPVADNATEEGRQQNRRIEITVLKEQ